jgi:hypothetical protein
MKELLVVLLIVAFVPIFYFMAKGMYYLSKESYEEYKEKQRKRGEE